MGINKKICELCGKREENLNYSYVEGVKLQVCFNCARFGKFAGDVKANVIEEPNNKFSSRGSLVQEEQEEELVVSDYAGLIRNKREKLGLSQKEFAMKLNEKESYVASLENGKLPLSIEQAKKLGKILGLELVYKEKAVHLGKGEKTGALTIGDLLAEKLEKK